MTHTASVGGVGAGIGAMCTAVHNAAEVAEAKGRQFERLEGPVVLRSSHN